MAVVYVHASGFAVCLSVYASVRVVMHSALLLTDLMTATAASLASNPVLPKEHPLKASKQASKQASANNVCLGTFTNHYHLITKPLLKSASSLISLRCWSVAHAIFCPTFSVCLCSCLRGVVLQAGLIINIGSIAGEMGFAPMAVYAATKWGLRGWSLSCYEVCVSSSACQPS